MIYKTAIFQDDDNDDDEEMEEDDEDEDAIGRAIGERPGIWYR